MGKYILGGTGLGATLGALLRKSDRPVGALIGGSIGLGADIVTGKQIGRAHV